MGAMNGAKQKGDGRIGHLVVQHIGCVGHHDAAPSRRRAIHPVIANAEMGGDFQVGQKRHPVFPEASDDGGPLHPRRVLRRNRGRRIALHADEIENRLQPLDHARMNRIINENGGFARHRDPL